MTVSTWFPDGLDWEYIGRLVALGKRARKIPWSCSLEHQAAVADILITDGIVDEMTMEETQAFCANEEVGR